jgi:hypothetical protein
MSLIILCGGYEGHYPLEEIMSILSLEGDNSIIILFKG